MDSNHVISTDDYKKQIRDLKRHNVLSYLVTICFTFLLYSFLLYLFTGTLSFSGTGYILLLVSLLCGSIMVSILCAKSLTPMVTSLTTDCDPHKFIALNRAIKRRFYPLPVAYTLGYFFLGDFEFSAMYAEQAARARGLTFSPHRFSMHCFKAYSEYMQGLYPTADHTIRNFEDLLSRSKPQEQKK